MTNPTKTLVPPLQIIGSTLTAAGGAADTYIQDISGAQSFFVSALNGVFGDVTIQLGDEGQAFPIAPGMFVRTSGFRRIRIQNFAIATRTFSILFSADPNFLVVTARIT